MSQIEQLLKYQQEDEKLIKLEQEAALRRFPFRLQHHPCQVPAEPSKYILLLGGACGADAEG